MANSPRERWIFVTLAVVTGLLLIDRLLIEPYVQLRGELKSEVTANRAAVSEDRNVLAREVKLQRDHGPALAQLATDPTIAESQLLHQLHRWEHDTGLSNTSFQRMQTHEQGGFNLLTFHVTADGSMIQIATFAYELETSPMLVRLDEFHLVPKRSARPGGEDGVQLQANIATLCKATVTHPQAVADSRDGAGTP